MNAGPVALFYKQDITGSSFSSVYFIGTISGCIAECAVVTFILQIRTELPEEKVF